MKEKFDPSCIAICTILYYPHWYPGDRRSDKNTDKIRGDLALQTLKESVKKGYITVAVHSGNEDFDNALHAIPGIVLVHRVSLKRSPAKRQAIRKVTSIPGIKVVVLTEAEKLSFVKDCIPPAVEPILSGKADIVIPKRNPELFKSTYPDYMCASEMEGNYMYNEELKAHKLIPIHHEGFDMFFGPRVLKNDPDIVDLFLKQYSIKIDNPEYDDLPIDQEDYSNSVYYPVISAMAQGKRVMSVEVSFKYPAIQKENEEEGAREAFIQKRTMQRIGIIIELIHFVASLGVAS